MELEEHGLQMKPIFVDDNCRLPIKRRFLECTVQVMRHDIEAPNCALDKDQIETASLRLQKLTEDGDTPDIAIFSDYNKGLFASPDFRLSNFYPEALTIVDPKKGPIQKWHGCTIFKPNAKEATELSGLSNWRDQCKYFQDTLDCESVVITMGGEKVAGVWKDEFFEYRPSRPVHVESVIGAGDCFAAFFAMAVGYGFTVAESAEIAWNAGAVYVQANMNRPIIPGEVSWDGIVEPEDLRSRDFKLVFTNGCFDLLHEGHLNTLRFAKDKGDKLVVALNSDESIRKLKGEGRPVKPLEQRMAVMSALEMVDFVVSFPEETPAEVIDKIKPDALVKGGDWKTGTIVGEGVVPEIYRAPVVDGLSTTGFLAG
jgi:D-beta-D-heptose 7-phosphate kinase/D-beta-D-heptose 1-phosphate adenosyltransferase